jgi:hypothetical protein
VSPSGRATGVLRVIQWTTGNVARQTVRAVMARPDLQLVGVYAHSEEKAGKDVAELCGLPEATGVRATTDVAGLVALVPDCVIYTPLHPDVEELTEILRRGINVVTSSEFLTGSGLDPADRATIARAAETGGATIFGSGMNPGYAALLASVSAGLSIGVRHIRLTESVDVSLFAGDANMDDLGWGRPEGDPTHPADVERATAVFAEGVEVLARIVGLDPDELRCTVEFAIAEKDLDLPGRPIARGTVAGIDVRWEALVGGHPMIESHQRWVMSRSIRPAWTVEHGYVVEVAGDPSIKVKLDIWPDVDDLGALTLEDIHAIGMRITGLPLVNAIPSVCAADPGIRTYADLPTVSTRLTPPPRP